MRRILLLSASLLMIVGAARADHIGIYSDATGMSCRLQPGFSTTAAVIHKYTVGTAGGRFKISFSNAPGSTLFSFNPSVPFGCDPGPCPPGFIPYPGCSSPTVVVGTILANYAGSGFVEIVPADGDATVIAIDCSAVEHVATGGRAYIGGSFDPCEALATKNATWGKVKALYRN